MEDNSIKEILIEKNPEFKKMYLQHQEYDQLLRRLNEKRYKTQKDLLEEISLKKMKLMVKDKMQKYIIEYRNKVVQ